VEAPVLEVGASKVDAKRWQIAKVGKVWEVELEQVEAVGSSLPKMLKEAQAAPLETQLMGTGHAAPL
jgi:hypothetical protein